MTSFRYSLSVLCLFVFSFGAHASVIDSATAPITLLEDNDFEVLLGGTDKIVNVGEFLLAIAEFPTFKDAATNSTLASFTPSTRMLTGISLLKVASVDTTTLGPIGARYTFSAPTPAEWLAQTGLAGVSSGTMLIAYDDPISSPSNHIVNGPSIGAGITSATEGSFLYELGYTGAGGAPATDEFWVAQTLDTNPAGGFTPTDISAITSLDFFAALNVISQAGGTPVLGTHNYLGTAGNPLFTGPSQFQIEGSEDSAAKGVFDVATDTNGYIAAVPEPATFVVWMGLAAAVAGLSVVRRRA
jgi:hypothetical protein